MTLKPEREIKAKPHNFFYIHWKYEYQKGRNPA